jgi:hypothetical protein
VPFMNKLSFALIFCFAIFIMSCSKKTLGLLPNTSSPAIEIESIDFEYFHGKARMVLRDANKEQEVKANIRIRKDSVIWMTFSVIGIQGGKALINKDSITIVSTLEKEYYVFSYEELSRRFNFPINYDVIQASLLGNPLLSRSNSDEVEQLSSMYLLKQHTGTVEVINFVNSSAAKIEKIELKETNSNNTLDISYSNFQPVGNKLFPYNGTISLFYKAATGLLNTTIIFEYNKAEVGDRQLRFPFNIPKKYDRK